MPINRHTLKAETDLYAGTLLDALYAEGGIDAVMTARDQLSTIIAYNRSHVDLYDALASVATTAEERSSLVKNVFADCLPAVKSVLGVMAERDDIARLPRVWESFNQQIRTKTNMSVVDVVTCVPLDDHLREVIKQKASADLGGEVVLNESVDPSILGGIIMSANGKRIDASVATLAEAARNVLKQNSDGGEAK